VPSIRRHHIYSLGGEGHGERDFLYIASPLGERVRVRGKMVRMIELC